MKKIEEVTDECIALLKKHGVETAVVIAKCPDSKMLGLSQCGDVPWTIGIIYAYVLDILKMKLWQGNQKPPENEGFKDA